MQYELYPLGECIHRDFDRWVEGEYIDIPLTQRTDILLMDEFEVLDMHDEIKLDIRNVIRELTR